MITANDIRDQVTLALTNYVEDFEIDGVVSDIVQAHGLVDIDTIPTDEFWAIVRRNEKGD